jgi:superfamily I DNA/RNA helicase
LGGRQTDFTGDPLTSRWKPSIVAGGGSQAVHFRFRRADPAIYVRAAAKAALEGRKVNITQNFRSAPGIINFVNSFFTATWPWW